MEDLVSIIIPVYNAQKYLRRCLNSVRNQTYKNLEIILVDDGSTDKSPKICDEYARKDRRFKVIHQVNEGICGARNVGIELAGGGYLTFVDDDDWLPKKSIELLYRKMKGSAVDFVCGDAYRVLISGAKLIYRYEEKVIEKKDKEKFSKFMPSGFTPWAKLYKTDIIKKNSVKYSRDVNIIEDCYFVYLYLQFCDTVALISEGIYYSSRINTSSETRRYHSNINKCYYLAHLERLKLFDSGPLSVHEQEVILEIFRVALEHYVINLEKNKAIDKLDETWKMFAPLIKLVDVQRLDRANEFVASYMVYKQFLANNDLEKCYAFLVESESKKSKNYKRVIRKLTLPLIQFFVYRLNIGYKK